MAKPVGRVNGDRLPAEDGFGSCLLHDQDRTSCQLHNAVGAAADHTLVQRRMPGCTDNKKIGANFVHEVGDDANGMAAHNVDLYLDAVAFGLKARTLDYRTRHWHAG
jgi:hypothetical protein